MQINFFGWIREGVKQSVLLGVSDAVEHLGMPPESDDGNQQLLEFLREQQTPALAGTQSKSSSGSGGGRRRLGRSLKNIAEDEQKG